MNGRQTGTPWKSILGFCDETEALRAKTRESGDGDANAHGEIRRRRTEIRTLLEKELRSGSLVGVAGDRKLTVDEAEILAVLLRRYVDPRSPWLTGREVLERIAEDSFSKLRAVGLLAPDGTLRTEGLVAVDKPTRTADPLDTRYRLSDTAAALFFDAPRHGASERRAPRRSRPYRGNREYLLDLRDLAELCRRRAQAIFGGADGEGHRPGRDERRQLERRIRVAAGRIEQDLRATPERHKFPMVEFQNDMALTPEESLVVVDLLFAELFEGEPSLEVVELLQLVSRSEEDLLRRRKMLSPESALVRRNIVGLEEGEEERDTTGRVVLSRWVVDRILGEDTSGRAIAPDERIDFHLYLKDLDSSARFYRDLAGGDDSTER